MVDAKRESNVLDLYRRLQNVFQKAALDLKSKALTEVSIGWHLSERPLAERQERLLGTERECNFTAVRRSRICLQTPPMPK